MCKRTVSIVTPTYNSMRTLDTYMNAILMQTYPHEAIELIFADGGSTDGTLEQISKYSENCDISIKLFENPLCPFIEARITSRYLLIPVK